MNFFYEDNSFVQENGNDMLDQSILYENSLKNNLQHFHELNPPSERPTFSNTHLENENREFVDPEPIIQIDDNNAKYDK